EVHTPCRASPLQRASRRSSRGIHPPEFGRSNPRMRGSAMRTLGSIPRYRYPGSPFRAHGDAQRTIAFLCASVSLCEPRFL
ncbi:MAG: hypothetical protein AVDCRST_MAG68-1303, partial [uncultured Gemmatimonadetes bacterium]